MKFFSRWLVLSCLLTCVHHQSVLAQSKAGATVDVWLTTHDGSVLFQKQSEHPKLTSQGAQNPTITIEPGKTFQSMDGFGYTLTGGSATLIHKMSAQARKALLTELFSTNGNNIGVSYLRLSIGASDMNERVFSYDDLPAGKTDLSLSKFSLAPDDTDLVPVLKEILAINPNIKILGSPWSAPVWMKDSADTRGHSLKNEYQPVYANYLVKYVQAMKQRGIIIDAITVQNEPLHPGNNPSMFMPALQQADFIRNDLGPAFKKAGIKTKIIIYDHNLDRIDYPIIILEDAKAAQYIDGTAFHLYAGTIDDMSKVHDSFPNKNLYFTEQWTSGKENTIADNLSWHLKNMEIGAPRNWSKTVLEWNLAIDPEFNPHTDRGGCNLCLGAVTIDGDKVTRNPAYYTIAHSSKFVRPGSVRLASNVPGSLVNVAYRTPDKKTVLVVLNDGNEEQTFTVKSGTQSFEAKLAAGSAATYVW